MDSRRDRRAGETALKLALTILVAVLLLAGCGHAKDPFVGTWRAQTKDGPSFVISKQELGYLVTADRGGDLSFEGVGVLDGHGDTLTVSLAISTGSPSQIEMIRLTASPHTRLQAIDKGVAGQKGPGPLFFGLLRPRATLVRVSNSTTAPTPSP